MLKRLKAGLRTVDGRGWAEVRQKSHDVLLQFLDTHRSAEQPFFSGDATASLADVFRMFDVSDIGFHVMLQQLFYFAQRF
jgi:hypothetical protein